MIKESTLGELAIVQTGPFGSQLKNEQYITGGTPVVTVEHIKNFSIADFQYPSVSDDLRESLSKYKMKSGDILFSRVGSVDLSAYVKDYQEGWLYSSRMLCVRPKKELFSRYLAYYFQLRAFRKYIIGIAVGATMPSINTSILKSIPIKYPPLEEQKAIAEVLSSLDDKIELLQKQNETLEALAQTLFRQWFIEEADDSWEEVELVDCCDYVSSGGTPKTTVSEYYDGDVNWFSTKELKDGYLYGSEKHISISGLEHSAAKLFPENSVLIAIYAAPTVGRLGILTKPSAFNQAACGLVANTSKCSTEFIYLQLLNDRNLLNLMASGTAQQNLNVGKIKSHLINLPPKNIMDKFNVVVQPLFKKIRLNGTSIQTIQKTRDTLLPKLMSGQVRVKLD